MHSFVTSRKTRTTRCIEPVSEEFCAVRTRSIAVVFTTTIEQLVNRTEIVDETPTEYSTRQQFVYLPCGLGMMGVPGGPGAGGP